MATSKYYVEYDDVYSAVQSLLDSGKLLDEISLRMIRDEMGDRGSLSTISKLFGPIKERLMHGEAIASTELSETDMDALRNLVGGIVEHRTVLVRKEKEDNAQAMLDIIRQHEADLSMKDEIIRDLEIDGLNEQVARLEGMVEALNATIATLAGTRDEPAVTKAEVVKEQPPATKADRPKGGQAEMPLVTSDDADQADVAGDDRG